MHRLIKRGMLAAVPLIASTTILVGVTWAQSPDVPTPTSEAGPATTESLENTSQESRIRPDQTQGGPPPCPGVTEDSLTARGGSVSFRPALTETCPEGSTIVFVIDYGDGSTPTVGVANPAVEWRAERVGEGTHNVTIRPEVPSTVGDSGNPIISPPVTGSGAIASTNRDARSATWGYVTFSVAVVLAMSSLRLAMIRRRR